MNLRTGNWNLPLVLRLCGQATVLKLNEAEARTLSDLTGLANEGFSLEEFCKEWADRYSLEAVCVTLGSAGCFVYQGSVSCAVAGYEVAVRDTVGAGDAFAAAFLHGYHRKWSLRRTASFANALGSLVASRAGATPVWTLEECLQIAGVRDRDRTATE
jgi:fructokinase